MMQGSRKEQGREADRAQIKALFDEFKYSDDEQYYSRAFSLITAEPNWQKDEQLVVWFDQTRWRKEQYAREKYGEEWEIVLLQHKDFRPQNIPEPDYSKATADEREALEAVYNFLAYNNQHQYYRKAYSKVFQKILAVPNWNYRKQLVQYYVRLREAKCQKFELHYTEEDVEIFIDESLKVRQDMSLRFLPHRELELVELGLSFLSSCGPHRTYKPAFDHLFAKIASCPDWRQKRHFRELYRELKEDERRISLFGDIFINKLNEPSYEGLTPTETKAAQYVFDFVAQWEFNTNAASFPKNFDKIYSVRDWQRLPVLVWYYKLLRNQKRLAIKARHIEEDLTVLPEAKGLRKLQPPNYNCLSKEEIDATDEVYRFLVNDGPHRTYRKAYQQLFEKIASVKGWRQNEQLVDLYQALLDEWHDNTNSWFQSLALKLLDGSEDPAKPVTSKQSTFQRQFARQREIRHLTNHFSDNYAEALELGDLKQLAHRVTAVPDWQNQAILSEYFVRITRLIDKYAVSQRRKLSCAHHEFAKLQQSTDVSELEIEMREEEDAPLLRRCSPPKRPPPRKH